MVANLPNYQMLNPEIYSFLPNKISVDHKKRFSFRSFFRDTSIELLIKLHDTSKD